MELMVKLYINGEWVESYNQKNIPIINPASEQIIGKVAYCHKQDLDKALYSAHQGFNVWKSTPAFDRSNIMKRAADLLRERIKEIAVLMSLEQGKPISQSQAEITSAIGIIEWFAAEAVRVYGQVIPSRNHSIQQITLREPIGPVAAFTPWNFPINQIIRKLCAALAAGCSIIIKAPEETPISPAELIKVFHDAGIPAGVINLIYGNPAEISEYLISNPIIKKVSFTGSTAVGKQIASLAGQHMKRVTMELGGHAPVIICADADIDLAIQQMVIAKFRNAGQVCIAPTRFLIQEEIYNIFKEKFVKAVSLLKVGPSDNVQNDIGPLIHEKALNRVKNLVEDATTCGAKILIGGQQLEHKGYFYQATVLENIPLEAKVLSEEPFGPLALLIKFKVLEEAIDKANSLPYGLAAYAYTYDSRNIMKISNELKCGMIAINHVGLALPEVPFGGVKESGYGTEGGSEAIECYLDTKLVSLHAESKMRTH